MPRIPLRLPAPGESPIADAIRKRRAPRDLTALDGVLLNSPEIANGWNTLLGAVRTKSSLPGDIRELLILRVAARNRAAYEWIHHEHVGRDAGLTTLQLAVIRDISRLPSPSSNGPLSSLQAAALRYGDAMTRDVTVPQDIFESLKSELSKSVGSDADKVSQLMLEATATVASYNMVSRLLVALNVGEKNDEAVPYPGAEVSYVDVPVSGDVKLHAKVSKIGNDKPWIIFVNSLLTNFSMWDGVAPTLAAKYNLILYDQRGHGKSSVPAEPCTIDQLADDVTSIASHLKLSLPLHAVVGVSQGGATTLATAIRHPNLSKLIVACDTQAKSPEANIAAWDERIALARKDGMSALAEATVSRWFPSGSDYVSGRNERIVRDMISSTPLEGFVAGARALQGYDLLPKLSQSLDGKKTLLIAGERDGKLPEGLKNLAGGLQKDGRDVRFEVIGGAGHLPMVDQSSAFLNVLEPFLDGR